jgi:Response regulator containing a CheY-like receiver domain and an HTH DNA-binding domain
MQILLVEDDDAEAQTLCDAIDALELGIAVAHAKSRDAAIRLINDADFDLIICDLKIPPTDADVEGSLDHGRAVAEFARSVAPGTPIRFFTAFADSALPVVGGTLSDAPPLDVFGTRTLYRMADSISKGDLEACLDCVREYAKELRRLDQIVLDGGGIEAGLSHYQKRVLRIFASRYRGTVVKIEPLSGLSGAITLRATVFDEHETPTSVVVAKIASMPQLATEYARYDEFVVPLLLPGAYAGFTGEVRGGTSKIGGLFYKNADHHDHDLFQVIRENEALASSAVSKLRQLEAPWRKHTVAKRVSIRDIRLATISDDEMSRYGGRLAVDWTSFESREIQVRETFQHGDLHGMNVLMNEAGEPLLIDYADVGIASASRDPVTLELSLIFHPKGREISGGWPSLDQSRLWPVVEQYVDGCPVPQFIQACRTWAVGETFTQHEVMANAYVVALKQLRYPDTNHDMAAAIADSAAKWVLDG